MLHVLYLIFTQPYKVEMITPLKGKRQKKKSLKITASQWHSRIQTQACLVLKSMFSPYTMLLFKKKNWFLGTKFSVSIL